MKCWLTILLLLVPVWARADGCAFGKGFTPQLRETHQLAVIHLTETTADVSMYIAIDGIPPGKPLTYVLPFWYRPDDFTMREERAESFREECVTPAHAAVREMQRIDNRRASTAVLLNALVPATAGLGFALLPGPFTISAKGRSDGFGGALTPYSVNDTPHAHMELYRIGNGELPRLIAQSGLPARYAAALLKYRTPYFAVMRLTGLTVPAKEARQMGQGIYYHFRHAITGGQYTYPLGTGAAWPQPIPLTEVYLTCPRDAALQVKAPTIGLKDKIEWKIRFHTKRLMSFLSSTPTQQQEERARQGAEEIAELLAAKTGSFLDLGKAFYPLAWHVVYLQSNPAKDIQVQVVHRPSQPWRLAVAKFFTMPWVAPGFCWPLFALSWLVPIRYLVRPRWLAAGSPGTLARHLVGIFFRAQGIGFISVLLLGWVIVSMISLPFPHPLMLIPIFIVLLLVIAVVLRLRQRTGDWRRWLPIACWACSVFLFLLASSVLYGFVYWCESLG